MKKRAGQMLTALAVSWMAAGSSALAQTNSTQESTPDVTQKTQAMEANALTIAAAASNSSFTTGPADKGLILNLRGARVDEVLNYLSQAAGFTIIREAGTEVPGTVDLASAAPLNKAEIVLLLNKVLAQRDLAALQDGQILTIMSVQDAQRLNRTPVLVWNNSAASIPQDARLVTEVIPLHSLSPTQVVKDLSSLLPPEAGVVANEGGNAIIMTARQADIRRFTQIIQALDSSGECDLQVFLLEHADAKAIAQELKEVFTAQDANASQGNPFQNLSGNRGRSAGGSENPRRAAIHVNAVSDDQNNAVLVSAPADIMCGISNLIHKLDLQQDDLVEIRIFGLHHADATDMANQITSLFPDPIQANPQNNGRGIGAQFVAASMATPPGAELSDRRKKQATVIAVPDPRTQSVIITASKDTLVQIANIIADLDSNAAGLKRVYDYRPEYADVADLQGPMSDLFGSISQSPTSSRPNALTQRANQAAQNSSPTTQGAAFNTGASSGGRPNQP